MARLSGNTLRAVRFYEEAGILQPARRSRGGHRLFDRRQLERLELVSDLRATGLSLDDIRVLLDLKERSRSGGQAASHTLAAIDEQVASLEQKIDVFSGLLTDLRRARELIGGCTGCRDRKHFPGACGECHVLCNQSELPRSVRVLWSVDDPEG